MRINLNECGHSLVFDEPWIDLCVMHVKYNAGILSVFSVTGVYCTYWLWPTIYNTSVQSVLCHRSLRSINKLLLHHNLKTNVRSYLLCGYNCNIWH